jgi:succinate-semialdehyde dehydrogenase / glutarate-semialdehyde dehydrogenase
MPPDTIERRAPLALKDSALLRQQCYIDGRWVDADARTTRDVINPATGVRIGTTPVMGCGETRPRSAARSCANGRSCNWRTPRTSR